MEATTPYDNHPLIHDVPELMTTCVHVIAGAIGNREHRARLSPIEMPALALAVVLQAVWIVAGIRTKFDPFPFVFLLTCSNVLQLILIFVLAVGQRQSAGHAELRGEHDHDSLSRLRSIAARTDNNVEKTAATVAALA